MFTIGVAVFKNNGHDKLRPEVLRPMIRPTDRPTDQWFVTVFLVAVRK